MQIRFVSLISQQNKPLYIQTFLPETGTKTDTKNGEDEMNELLKYNFLSHMSLDVFESPFCPPTATAMEGKPSLLFVQDGILVYGSETQTGLKVVIGCSRYHPTQKEDDSTKDDNDDIVKDPNSLGNIEGFANTDVIEVNDLTEITTDIRKEYLRYTCNPFMDVDGEMEIHNAKFDKNIKRIIDEFNSKH